MTSSSNTALLDTLADCRRVRDQHAGRIPDTWSTNHQIRVALVLDDAAHLAALGYARDQAREHVLATMLTPPTDMDTWLATIRNELEALTALDTTLTNLATVLKQDN